MTATLHGEPASAGLSTAPADEPPPPSRRRRIVPVAAVVRGWRRLTSMRTALVLLLLLALAALPGSLLPQRPLNPIRVDLFRQAHPSLGRFYDRLGLFDVFATPWFAALYLLLLVSLVGCLVPRLRLHARALRVAPLAAPRHLDRLPLSTSYDLAGDPAQIAGAAAAILRGRRWRVARRDEPDGVVSVAAEKGYLRETGNLLFHLALVGLLAAIAVGRLYGYQGTVIVEEGKGFCTTVSQFDSFRAGRLADRAGLPPLCADLDRFASDYSSTGGATSFRASIRYTATLDGPQRPYLLQVNHPLRVDGVRLYLSGHGYSPALTVRDPSGQVFRRITAPFLPQDSALTSTGAFKLTDARPRQIGLEGVFTPTATVVGNVLVSGFPAPARPAVGLVAYVGDLGLDSGRPQSVYAVDQTQLARGALRIVGVRNMLVGERWRLPDGTEITFDGYLQWAGLQVSRDPAQDLALLAAAGIVAGLLLSLSVRRRRLWLRCTPDADGGGQTAVAAGGLARTDRDTFAGEFTRLTDLLRGLAGPQQTTTSKDDDDDRR